MKTEPQTPRDQQKPAAKDGKGQATIKINLPAEERPESANS